MEETKYTLRNIQEKIDYGDVLNKAMDIAAKARDKELIADILKTNARLNNEIVVRAIDYSENITEKAMDFFERREAEYRRGGRLQKVFGFKRWSDIDRDSFYAALSDTREVLNIVSPLENPAVKALIASRLQTEKILTCHLSTMLGEDSFKKLGFKGMKLMLGSQE